MSDYDRKLIVGTDDAADDNNDVKSALDAYGF
jgi:hypothetical protein